MTVNPRTVNTSVVNSEQVSDRIRENWTEVLLEVAAAAQKAGRDPASIQVIGVTKYVDAGTTLALVDAGCCDLGESRPQVLWKKADALSRSTAKASAFRWHMIGHLQRNKIRRTIRLGAWIHSVDSMRLLEALSAEAALQDIHVDVLLEANISDEEAKTGMDRDSLLAIMETPPLPNIHIHGLMAMAGWGGDGEAARRNFSATRRLRDELQQRTGRSLGELSMGMSGDFAEAIAEGATMVRIGSRLFQGVDKNAK